MRLQFLLLDLAALSWSAKMTGYISDAACGWNNARPAKEARECPQKCVKAGWDPVCVLDGQMDTLKFANKTKAMPYAGDHVVIDAERKRDTLNHKSIRKVSPARRK